MIESVLHLDFETGFRGTENQLLLLHEALLDAGIRSFALASKSGELAARARKRDIPHIFGVTRVPGLGDFNPWLCLAVIQTCWKLRPQILHAHGAQSSGVVFFSKPFLPKETQLLFHRTVSNPLRSKFKYSVPDAVIVVCEYIKKDLVQNGINEDRVYVVPSGVPMNGSCGEEEGGQCAAPRERSAGALNIGSLSALDKHQKDLATLIRAFARISGQFPQIRLLIFGDGPDRMVLEALTGELKLRERVEFRGWWARPMEEAFAEMDIFVLPSLFEGTSNVLITALYCGVPSIATDIGGNPEVLADAGILVPAKDVEALSGALERLVQDSGFRRSLSEKARRRAPEFSVENTVRKTLACYDSMLKKARR